MRTARFDLVGLHWQGQGSVRFRTRALDGRWSAWRTAAPEGDDRPDRGLERSATGWRLGNPYWVGGSDALQVRKVGRVTRVRAYFVRSAGTAAASRARTPQLAAKPTIITRAQWDANEAIRRGAPAYADNVHLAIVHHTAGSNSYTAGQSAAIVRAIEIYHVKGNGWNDIGYNFLVDKYGQIFEGRYGGMTRAVIGAHAMGFNAGSSGVALIGNYSSVAITPAAKAALVSLLAWRLDLAHVDPLSKVVRISAGNSRYPAGKAVTLSRDLRAPRRVSDRLPRSEALRPAPGHPRGRGQERAPEAVRARGRGESRRAGALHGTALELRRLDGERPGPERGRGRERDRHGHEGRLDLGRERRGAQTSATRGRSRRRTRGLRRARSGRRSHPRRCGRSRSRLRS